MESFFCQAAAFLGFFAGDGALASLTTLATASDFVSTNWIDTSALSALPALLVLAGLRAGVRAFFLPGLSSASTSADTTSVTITYTPSTFGAAASSYLVTGTSTTGSTVNVAITTSPSTVTGFSSGQTYNVTVAGQNYNGPGAAASAATGLVIPAVYSLQSTYNSSGTYTVATGITKIAGFVISGSGGEIGRAHV